MRLALIDGDTLVYESTTATEQAIDWGEDLWTLHGFMNEAIEHFDSLVRKIQAAVEADEVRVALSALDPQRWREDIMPTYKQHRRDKRKPLLYRGIREHCAATYQTLERPKLEGDDILGILATHPNLALTKGATSKVVVSIDKDLKTIPGEHYNYQKQDSFTISEARADYHHFLQTLTGDATDGYPGCPKVGPVTAEKILLPFHTEDPKEETEEFDTPAAWRAIVAAYAKAKLGPEVALLNARVARICRHTDYNLQKKEVILWNPPVS